jgi:outer membrane protein assembly factor BamB
MGNTIKKLSIIAFVSVSLTTGVTYGQFGWTTSRGDAQRAGWVRTDGYISVENLQQQRFGLEWKRKLDNAPRQMNSLTPGVSAGDSGWNVTPVNIGGSSNNVYGIEIDTGGVAWSRRFDAPIVAGTPACPGGMTASVTRPTALNQIVTGSAGPFRGRGRRGPLSPIGGVGQPGEGVPMELMQRLGGGGAIVAAGASGGRSGAAAPAPVIPQYMYSPNLYVVASDGIMRTLGLFLGKDVQKPAPFLPANANVTDLIAVNETLYAATINGCGGAPNGIWAIDLASDTRSVTSWKNAASPVGAPALDSNGTVYVAIGEGPVTGEGYSNAIVALDPKTLQVKDSFTATNAAFASTPTILVYKGHEILAAATKDGRVFLLDTASLGGADHKTPLFVSAATTTMQGYSPSALATWEDSAQNRWLLAPVGAAKSSVAALKVTGDAARPALQPGWVSRDLVSPAAPIVVNGVAFVLSTGEYIPATGTATLADKISKSVPAVLYALDASTGKELWNSGKAITSFVHSAGLWSSDGQVYVATYDSTVYAFGFAMDRHL